MRLLKKSLLKYRKFKSYQNIFRVPYFLFNAKKNAYAFWRIILITSQKA
jgi:hypothetical protein